MRKVLGSIIALSILGGLAVYSQAQFGLFVKPCSRTITYSLGTFDSRFKMSQEDFLEDIEQAVAVWENPIDKNLFQYDPSGKLKINLIYDYRQEATERLKNLGYSIDSTQSSYESLKQRYISMSNDHNQLRQSLDQQVRIYDQRKQAYEKEVNEWNQKGGAPKNVVNQLNAEREALANMANQINRDQNTLNSLVGDINAMADLLNRMVTNLNLSVENYNNIGATRGEEFEEGAYISTGRSQQIDIYEFDNEERLIRLLAHEFGHALGLEHIEDPSAIMYRLNKASTSVATLADINQLKQLCGI